MSVSYIKHIIDNVPHLNASTKKLYVAYLNNFARWLAAEDNDINQLTRVDVQNFLDHLVTVRKLKASTINNYVWAIKTFAKETNQTQAVENLRFPKVKNVLEVAPKSLNRLEVNRLLRAVERDGNIRNIAIVYRYRGKTHLLQGAR